MNYDDFTWMYAKEVTEQVRPNDPTAYDGTAKECFERFADRIIDFRPPRIGESFVTWVDGEEMVATIVYQRDQPRYILKPVPKLLRQYTVKVWDEPPKPGERYMDNRDYRTNHFCVCNRSPQSPTKEDGYLEDGYFRSDKRVTVEEVKK